MRDPLKFLRAREVVHFQRFGDALRIVQDNLDAKNYYAFNPAMDIRPPEPRRMPLMPSMPTFSEEQNAPPAMQPPIPQ